MGLHHLSLKATIEPEISHLHVMGDAIFTGVTDKLEFLLNPCLEVNSLVAVDREKTVVLSTEEKRPPEGLFIPAACYETTIPEGWASSGELRVAIEYEGKLYRYSFDTTHIRKDYVELAIYALWYPIVTFEDRPTFEVELSTPDDWIWIMNAQRMKGLVWKRDSPATDLALHGRPRQNAINPESSQLFWGEPRNLEDFKPLETEFAKLQETLIGWLGDPGTAELRIVLVPRDFGGGYSRKGLIVVPDGMMESLEGNTESAIQYWGHEFAHAWFNKTSVNDYHNWIDEAFATYSSFLGIESVYGGSAYERYIEKYRKRLAKETDLPPITKTDRKHEKSQVLYYIYGTLILREIDQTIGRDTFLKFMAHFAKMCTMQDRIDTDDLIEALNAVTGKDWRGHIESRISTTPEPL
jgi:hypothetical protein